MTQSKLKPNPPSCLTELNIKTSTKTFAFLCYGNIFVHISYICEISRHWTLAVCEMFRCTSCQQWPVSLLLLVHLSERSTSRTSSGLSRIDAGLPVSARLKWKMPSPTKCLLTWNLKNTVQISGLMVGYRTCACSHQHRRRPRRWSRTLTMKQDCSFCRC